MPTTEGTENTFCVNVLQQLADDNIFHFVKRDPLTVTLVRENTEREMQKRFREMEADIRNNKKELEEKIQTVLENPLNDVE